MFGNNLCFGFLPHPFISALQVQDEAVRLRALEDLVADVYTTAVSNVHVLPFADYIAQLFCDPSEQVVDLACRILEALVDNLEAQTVLYRRYFLKIAVANFGSDRTRLVEFAEGVMRSLIEWTCPQSIVSEAVASCALLRGRFMTNLVAFLGNEVARGTIQPELVARYAPMFDDALESDELLDATNECIHEINDNKEG